MPVFPLCRNQTLNGLKGRGTNFTWYEKDVKQFFTVALGMMLMRLVMRDFRAGIYLFKVNNSSIKTMCGIYSQ